MVSLTGFDPRHSVLECFRDDTWSSLRFVWSDEIVIIRGLKNACGDNCARHFKALPMRSHSIDFFRAIRERCVGMGESNE
jgi:hypothetical protein